MLWAASSPRVALAAISILAPGRWAEAATALLTFRLWTPPSSTPVADTRALGYYIGAQHGYGRIPYSTARAWHLLTSAEII
ncbi:hypothetical protein M885DRAFT_519579 [Pelagophyceae sp. CCMP2097]|nr:hypothetical protein M885DRAFT_519579 [Pelagophyceae sp. CCMP2097]